MRIKTGNGTVKLFAFLVLLQVFLVSFSIARGDRNTKDEEGPTRNFSYVYFAKTPANPNVYTKVKTYLDSSLTKQAGQLQPDSKIIIKRLLENKNGMPIFQLANGNYVKASYRDFYDDQIKKQEVFKKSKSYWTHDKVTLYDKPYVAGQIPKKINLPTYSKIQVTQRAKTQHGSYLYVQGQGWIDAKAVSKHDDRIRLIQDLLQAKYNKADKYSIYVKQLNTGKTAQINADKMIYSASVSKLPLLYYVQEQINKGKIKSSQNFTYTPAVNDFKDAYKPEGSGNLSKTADNKPYSVGDLEKRITRSSDNVATNILGYYVAHQYDKDFHKTIKSAIGQDWDMKSRKVSAKTAGLMMEAIYKQNGDITNYLSSTDYDDQRISKDISVKVAHKIGDAYDYRHDVAIVYGETPFVLSIFTENASYDDITAIADDIYRMLK